MLIQQMKHIVQIVNEGAPPDESGGAYFLKK